MAAGHRSRGKVPPANFPSSPRQTENSFTAVAPEGFGEGVNTLPCVCVCGSGGITAELKGQVVQENY